MDVVVATWKDLQWNDLQNVIETEISALGERQDKGEEGRQQLLGESNKYRENTTKESRAVAVPLIKAFQKEVDGLSIRCKATEAALIHICSSLTNIPDPSAILEQAVSWKTQAEKTNRAVEEAEQLRLQIQDLHSEFADLKNQDVTIRQLRERIKQLESEKTIEVEQSIGETERLLREEFIAKEHEMSVLAGKLKTENNSLENKVSELEVRMRDAQRKLDSARVVADQQDMFESEQISILTRDLDTSQRRVAKLEEELSRLTRELSEEQSRQKMGGIEDIATLGGIMKDKDEQIAKLAAENKRLQEVSVDEIKKAMTARDELARQVERQNEQLRQMQVQLADRSDYEAIKKELRLLREMEFGETAEANAGAIARLGDTVQSLDRLLAEKNKRLQNDNAQLRQANQRFQGDDTLRALVNGHPVAMDRVGLKVGQDAVRAFKSESDITVDLEDTIERSRRHARDVGQRQRAHGEEPTNLFKILLNMGSPVQTMRVDSPTSAPQSCQPSVAANLVAKKRSISPEAEIPFEQFRYSPKLSNYTGEPPKSAHEIKAVEDLQTLVAENIASLGGKPLNTSEIAKQCKRLMMSYNIGQRLFAKHIMNQVSQGSLSELLSKPRHWSKLTDKGRDAFRRIYGWICDEKAVELLCTLSPRRVWPSEERVKHPTPESLWEINSERLPKEPEEPERERRARSAREDQYRLAGTNQAANSGTTHRNSRWRHDDIPKEKIMSIFQNEMAKLREQESNLERAIASRNFGHVRRVDDISQPYHEMSQKDRLASINHANKVMMNRMATGLQPITQEQFELFGHIDTDDVVNKIKHFLSMNSISQRQFGEHVLGLSQGSVSDLLARPKQWTQLTQKGREPFIRMKLFMKEVARTAFEDGDGRDGSEHEYVNDRSCSPENTRDKESPSTLKDIFVPLTNIKKEVDEDMERSDFDVTAACTSREEVDTEILVKRVKEQLHKHSIPQRLFGESVLGISAGATSDIFVRPKKWSSLVGRQKEPYVTMIQWLDDPDAAKKILNKDKTEVTSDSADSATINENGKRQSTGSDLDINSCLPPPRKVQRTVITDQQKEALRFVFTHEHHPSQKTVELLAQKLNLNIRTVNNWFHNHRTRQKASLREAEANRNTNWKQDLAAMLESVAASQNCQVDEDPLPTMVPVTAHLFSNAIDEERTELIGGDTPKAKSHGTLDKALARLQMLAAAKTPGQHELDS